MDSSHLWHMLGLDADHSKPWRNFFVGNADAEMQALLAEGLVEEVAAPKWLAVGDRAFRATKAGIRKAVGERRAQRVSRGRLRYHAFLRLRDVCADLTFADFLRRKLYLGVRFE